MSQPGKAGFAETVPGRFTYAYVWARKYRNYVQVELWNKAEETWYTLLAKLMGLNFQLPRCKCICKYFHGWRTSPRFSTSNLQNSLLSAWISWDERKVKTRDLCQSSELCDSPWLQRELLLMACCSKLVCSNMPLEALIVNSKHNKA